MRGPIGPTGALRPETFDVPEMAGASISNVLQAINRTLDPSVAYYLSCRRGLCACCVVRVDGKIEKACVVLARDGMTIEPVRRDLLVKDTVVHLGVPPEYHWDPRNGGTADRSERAARHESPGETRCD